MGEDGCALDLDHRFGLLFGEFPQFIAAGGGQHDGTGVFGASGKVAVFGFLQFCGILEAEDFGDRRDLVFNGEQVFILLEGPRGFLHGGHGSP